MLTSHTRLKREQYNASPFNYIHFRLVYVNFSTTEKHFLKTTGLQKLFPCTNIKKKVFFLPFSLHNRVSAYQNYLKKLKIFRNCFGQKFSEILLPKNFLFPFQNFFKVFYNF